MAQTNAAELIEKWRQGDREAAGELFRRYADRLIALASSRMSAKLAQGVDAEDIVQSAYRSFLADSRAGQYSVQPGGDLWQLLVTVTLHKLYDKAKWAQAQKRAADRELHFGSEDSLLGIMPHVLNHEPSPIEAAALADEKEYLLRRLDPVDRQIVELRLQGLTLKEIASQVDCSVRTVERTFERIRQQLAQDESLSHPGES
jgi:RNA polymerase sigma-70 factor, ECF subfamily